MHGRLSLGPEHRAAEKWRGSPKVVSGGTNRDLQGHETGLPTRSKIRVSSCVSPTKHTAKSISVRRTTAASRFKESGQSSRRTVRRASNRIWRRAPRVGTLAVFPISAPLVDMSCTRPVPVNALLVYKAGIERRYRGATRCSSLGCLGSISASFALKAQESPTRNATLGMRAAECQHSSAVGFGRPLLRGKGDSEGARGGGVRSLERPGSSQYQPHPLRSSGHQRGEGTGSWYGY